MSRRLVLFVGVCEDEDVNKSIIMFVKYWQLSKLPSNLLFALEKRKGFISGTFIGDSFLVPFGEFPVRALINMIDIKCATICCGLSLPSCWQRHKQRKWLVQCPVIKGDFNLLCGSLAESGRAVTLKVLFLQAGSYCDRR